MSKIWRFELTSLDTTSGAEGQSHLHYQTNVGVLGSEPSANTMLDKVLSHFSGAAHNMSVWQGVMRNSTKLTEARIVEEVTPGSADLGDVAVETLSVVGTRGAIGGDHLPPEACLWFGYRTGVASRSARGGTHLPSIIDASELNSSGRWDTGYVNAVAVIALADSIKDVINDIDASGTDLVPGVYSRTRRGRSESPYFFQLTSVTRSDVVRWLRRRAV